MALFLALELTETCPSVLPAPCSRFLCCGALCLHLPPGLLHAAPLHCDRLPRQPALGLPFVGLGLPRGWPRHAALQLPVDVSACPGGRGRGGLEEEARAASGSPAHSSSVPSARLTPTHPCYFRNGAEEEPVGLITQAANTYLVSAECWPPAQRPRGRGPVIIDPIVTPRLDEETEAQRD